MKKSAIWLGSFLVSGMAIWGCGSSDSGLENGPGSGGAAGASGGSAGGSSGSGGGSAGSLACEGTHPEVDGGDRRCPEGECRCSTDGADECLAEGTAAECCGEGELECFREGGKFDCKGEHPQVDGGKRFCLEGACYCEGRDACMAAEIAAACCPDTPKCN